LKGSYVGKRLETEGLRRWEDPRAQVIVQENWEKTIARV